MLILHLYLCYTHFIHVSHMIYTLFFVALCCLDYDFACSYVILCSYTKWPGVVFCPTIFGFTCMVRFLWISYFVCGQMRAQHHGSQYVKSINKRHPQHQNLGAIQSSTTHLFTTGSLLQEETGRGGGQIQPKVSYI